MRVSLGYPDAGHERELLRSEERRVLLEQMQGSLDSVTVCQLQQRVRQVHVSERLLDYLQQLLSMTRTRPDIRLGLSPRAGQGLLRAAQAWAFVDGRNAVLPDDVQAVFPAVANHRLVRDGLRAAVPVDEFVREIIGTVPVPE
jgi:MoxR-like ATPase